MEELWDIARVAQYLGVSERTVYNRVRAGELPAIKVGRLWRVRLSDLDSWLGAPATEVAREVGPRPTRAELESLLAPLVDPLARRLAFVGLLSRACEELGWPAPVVVGGNAVEFYTAGDYATVDVDLAGASEPIAQALAEWGFERQGRHFFDEALNLVLEVPGSRLAPEQLEHVAEVRLGAVVACVLGIEDLIVDRLAACKFWNDSQACQWARVLLVGRYEIDREYLAARAAAEDVADTLADLEARS